LAASRDAGSGSWTLVELDRQAHGNRFELAVTDNGIVYLLRGVRAQFEDELESKGYAGYGQEILYLERYQGDGWESLQTYLGNTYPTQNDHFSALEADMALDAAGNAYLAWIDNGPAWEESSFRLQTKQIISTTVPQVTKHYYANGQRVASRVDGDLYYIVGDHLGSTSLVVDDSGAEVGHVIYDAYGQIVENTVPLTLTDRLYTGQVFDASTGLYFYNARYYDPFTGQFTQPDSLVPDPLNPAAWNRFSYVYGNPSNLVDPSGHNPLLIAAGIGLFALGW
jgi:RHS repeat-associated protein